MVQFPSQYPNQYSPSSGGGSGTETHVFLVAGQSNMIGRDPFDSGDDYPTGYKQVARTGSVSGGSDNQVVDAQYPLDHAGAVSGDYGPALEFCVRYAAAYPDVNVVLVPAAQGGTSLNVHWKVGAANYNDAITRVNTLLAANESYLFKGILWHQGESDEGNASYETQLDAMIAGMRTAITGATASTPFILGRLSPNWLTNADRIAVDASINDTPNRVTDTYVASATGLTGVDTDQIHFDTASIRTLGGRYFDQYISAVPLEQGAEGHWLLGNDNVTDSDLVAARGLIADPGQTIAPTRSTGYLTTGAGQVNGLSTGLADGAAKTQVFVVRKPSSSHDAIIGGTLTSSIGSSLWFFGTDLRYRDRATANITIEASATHNVWLFCAVSEASNGDYIAFRGDSSSHVVSTGNSARVATALDIGVASINYDAAGVDGSLDFAEVIVFDSALTQAEIEAVYERSAARLSERGITLE